MKVKLPKGKYVLAVSGGVDSMALLDLLAKQPGVELVVAHFNHGIRPESGKDEEVVRKTAIKLKTVFEVRRGRLGPKASEAAARTARYKFLEKIRQKHHAKAIITAHHQDDLLETALLNILRGTGWRGLTSIRDDKDFKRPLLEYSKAEITKYALKNRLMWRQDNSNSNTDYLRNYLRLKIMPKLNSQQRKLLLTNLKATAQNKVKIHNLLATISQSLLSGKTIDRSLYSVLPRDVTRELLLQELHGLESSNISRQTVNKLDLAIRNSPARKRYPIDNRLYLQVENKSANLLRI